ALRGVNVALDAAGTLPVAQIERLTDGRLSVWGVDRAFAGLADASGTAIVVDGVHLDLGSVTRLRGGSVSLSGGGTVDLGRVADIDGASLYVGDGVTLSLPGITAYAHAGTDNSQVRTLR